MEEQQAEIIGNFGVDGGVEIPTNPRNFSSTSPFAVLILENVQLLILIRNSRSAPCCRFDKTSKFSLRIEGIGCKIHCLELKVKGFPV